MKILVYNYKGQFALSRKQIEAIQNVLPKVYFAPLQEFHITTKSPGQERFEFDYNTKIAHFEYKVEQKTIVTTEDALEHILVGLKRIKDKDTFGHFIKPSDLASYEEFISVWKEKCLEEFQRIKNRG